MDLGTINGRPVAPYIKRADRAVEAPTPETIREHAVYEPLLGWVGIPGQHLGPVIKALLAAADLYGERERVLRLIMDRRRYFLARNTRWQREWQAKASRRPLRNRHHDSWGTREKYVRCEA